MIIDLSNVDIFEDDMLELDKKCTFIFGKNGAGKTAIAKRFELLSPEYDVSVFQGFDELVDDDEKLNAIVLGKDNTEINKAIKIKEKEKAEILHKRESILKGITEPEDGSTNFYTRKTDAENKVKNAEKDIDNFFIKSASAIKQMTNPQIVKTTYDKNDFRKDIESAKTLLDQQIEEAKETIRTEEKIATNIVFPKNIKDMLEDVNLVLEKAIKETIVIERLEGNYTKRNFAKKGIEIHKKGEVCAFCGNKIDDKVFDELERYFSADEVVSFQNKIAEMSEEIQGVKEMLLAISISSDNFYPEFRNEVSYINGEFLKLRDANLDFLNNLLSALEEKKKNLFKSNDRLEIECPNSFDEISSKYKELQKKNNESDLNSSKEIAKEKLRLHYVKVLLEEKGYELEKVKIEQLNINAKQLSDEYNIEKNKIDGPGGLNDNIKEINSRIEELLEKTKSEKLLADRINKKLSHMVPFELVHIDGGDQMGFYNVKSLLDNSIRDVTKLSTGEKNIVAFLYFLEKLSELKDVPSKKNKIVVFDDPMNSNDDGMQYLIMEELQKLMKDLGEKDRFILLTHNKHFYINIKYGRKFKKDKYIHIQPKGYKSKIIVLQNEDEDFCTSYESLWQELKILYYSKGLPDDILINPIRRIVETFAKFSGIQQRVFLESVKGAKKLFDVNSHSIDDFEAELNGKTKTELMQMLCDCFSNNHYQEHFEYYWKDVYKDNNGRMIIRESI